MKYFNLIILLIISDFIFPVSTQAQLEWNNWIVKNGITGSEYGNKYNFINESKIIEFNQNIINIDKGMHQNYELTQYSSISDINGNLLFFTNSLNIFDTNGKIVSNSKSIIIERELKLFDSLRKTGTNRIPSIDMNLILPPLDGKSYYNYFYLSYYFNPGLHYGQVEVGNKSIGVKSNDLTIVDSVIGLASCYNKTKDKFWIVTYDYNINHFKSILVNENNSIEFINSISSDQQFFNLKNSNPFYDSYNKLFNIKISPNGNYLAVSYNNYKNNYIYLYNFNNITGEIDFNSQIKLRYNINSDFEFSPNGRFIYTYEKNSVEVNNLVIGQLDLFNLNYSVFYPSIEILKYNTILSFTEIDNIQLAIDKKIYISGLNNLDTHLIISIENPNKLIDDLILKKHTKKVNDNGIKDRFPNSLTINSYLKVDFRTNSPICSDYDTLKLFSLFSHSEIPDVTYEWTAPNGNVFTKDSIYIPNPNMSFSGRYYLRVKSKFLDVDMLDSIDVKLFISPDFKLKSEGELCEPAEITLKSDVEFPTNYKYLWNTGATTRELKVSKNGVYTLIVTDTNGCQTSKSIEIIFGKKPIAEIKAMGATTFCEGGRVELRSTGGMSSNDLNFEWSNGEKVPNIWVDKSGIYKVTITHKFSNCRDSAEIEVKVNPNLVSSIEQIGALCKGGEVTLQAEPQGTEYKYLWSNGATTPSITITQAGKYTVEVSLDGACKSSAEIEVLENQAEDFEILATGKFCVGDSVMLTPSKKFKQYLWSTGDMTEQKGVTKSGTYTLIVTDENGCTNEKSIDIEFKSPREYVLDFTDYDFGEVEIGTEKRVKVNIPGDVEIKIRGEFPLDITTMEMIFKPDAEGDYSGEIVLNYGGECDTSVTITFKGRGVNSVKYFAKVIAPKVTTQAGLDNVELPITFEINDENMIYPFELDYKINLSLNYDVYLPLLPSIINGTKREIEVTGKTQINKGENIINVILGKTYLSQNMENEINILSFEHKTDRLEVEQEDGYLNITGMCLPGLRGLNFFTPTTVSVSPNPVSSDLTIKINTEEIGNHKLRLIDITGNTREIDEFEVKELTEKVIKLNVKDLAKGQYFLELVTPNQTISEKVVVE